MEETGGRTGRKGKGGEKGGEGTVTLYV